MPWLLIQLSTGDPPDSKPYFNVSMPEDSNGALSVDEYSFSADAGVTIILACRDPARGQEARQKLLLLLDSHIAKLKQGSPEQEYAGSFRRNVKLSVELLNLASIESVLEFCRTLHRKYVATSVFNGKNIQLTTISNLKYEYISHLILNAGTATFSHLDKVRFIVDLARYPMFGARNPRANIQVSGVMSQDKLGYVFQCNVFGHYVLVSTLLRNLVWFGTDIWCHVQYRSLEPLLVAYANDSGISARVLWMGSLEAAPLFHPDDDWQLTETMHSYQGSKYEVELLSFELDKRALNAQSKVRTTALDGSDRLRPQIRHIIVSPGVIQTNMSKLLNIKIPGYLWQARVLFGLVSRITVCHIHD